MSEEEIIKEFKNLIYNSEFDYIELMDEDGFTGWHELFENILDLYNKEKEKNKKAIDYIEKNKEKFKNLDYAYPEAVINHFNKINNILKGE